MVLASQGKVGEIQQHKELCRENEDLKKSHAGLQEQNSNTKAELRSKQEELETVKHPSIEVRTEGGRAEGLLGD